MIATATLIGLEAHHTEPVCTQFAWPLLEQLQAGDYTEMAVLPLEGLDVWLEGHRTARKRSERAARRGYRFARVERHRRSDEIHQINLSSPSRQGRPMSNGYRMMPSTEPLPSYPCDRHGVHTYGLETKDGKLVAYSWIYRSGELALVSSILGHAEHLEHEIMYLLIAGIVQAESPQNGYLVYNRYDSGTDGLRFFKDRCGFRPVEVEWGEW